MKQKTLYTLLYVLLGLGIIFSSVLVYDRYFWPEGKPSFCAFGGNFDCAKLAQSPYARMDGIFYAVELTTGINMPYPVFLFAIPNPIALILAFSVWIIALARMQRGKGFYFLNFAQTKKWLIGTSLFGSIFAIYLLGVASFVLETFCIFCLLLDVVMFGSAILFWLLTDRSSQ